MQARRRVWLIQSVPLVRTADGQTGPKVLIQQPGSIKNGAGVAPVSAYPVR